MLWNISLFPLVVVLDGEYLPTLFQVLEGVRQQLRQDISATNTVISLGFDCKDRCDAKSLAAVTFIKPKSIEEPNWDIWKYGFSGLMRAKFPDLTSGWFDFCMKYSGDSVAKFQEDFFSLKDEYGEKMLQATSVFFDVEV